MQQQKTAVITGASSGFGEAIAKLFVANHIHVCLGARREDRLKSLCKELSSEKTKAVYHALDVSSSSSVKEFSQFALQQFPRVDILVNNAGLAYGKDFIVDAKEEDWSAMFETNLMGVLRVTQAFLPGMEKSGEGHVINIGSIAGRDAYEGGAGYCGTKFALRAFTKTLRLETYGKNIRVTSIDPGMAETEFSDVRFYGDKQKAKAVYQGMTPLSAKDIADAVLYTTTCPPHVNIDEILITPTAQVSVSKVFRK